jgi:iron(III) transport system substrate-binding protein
MTSGKGRIGWLTPHAAMFLLLAGCGSRSEQPRVVLYCGQDQEFAEDVLKDFTQKSGIRVEVRSDTEADKSVSLYEALVREAQHPRCDVFWCNEILNTIRLERQGLLETYASPNAPPLPAWLHMGPADSGSFVGLCHPFAARARVLIVHNRVAEKPKSILDLTKETWRGKVAMAKPQFGTTATYAACLFQALGKEKAEKFFRDLRPNVTILPGNKDVAVAVADGRFDVGFTDTDDAIGEIKRGQPVSIVYPDQDAFGTLFYPSTVATMKGAPHPAAAHKLINHLLSSETEAKLAESAAAQIPLHPDVKVKPPIETWAKVKPMRVDFEEAAALWDEVQTFLRNEFARP